MRSLRKHDQGSQIHIVAGQMVNFEIQGRPHFVLTDKELSIFFESKHTAKNVS
jgi:hypothetical protein